MTIRFRREDVVFTLLAVGMLALGARHALLLQQAGLGYRAESDAECKEPDAPEGVKMTIPLPARPPFIYGRSRSTPVLLAGSRQLPSCFVDPSLLTDRQRGELAGTLAEIFDRDPGELYRTLLVRRDRRFVWVARRISAAQAEAIRKLDHRAVGIQYEWRREYPAENLAGTVLGYRRHDGVAGAGLELTLARHIQPQDGRRVVVGDARRRPIWPVGWQSRRPVDGGNVYLTLDMVIQEKLQQAVSEAVERYDAKWGVGVVIQPRTGDVLAMCSAPGFSPNAYNTTDPDQMLNRVISAPYEPGSALKPIFAAAAVEDGVLGYQTRIFCENGVYRAHRGGRISDHGNEYGYLTLWDVLVKSSNIGMAKVGEQLGNRRMWEIAHRWGFGQETGIDLPGETGGIIRDVEKWDGYSMRRIPFGQEISVSALQLAMAFGAIANGGVLMSPRLVDCVTDPSGEVLWSSRPRVRRRVLSPGVARQTLEALADVVDRGTGKSCRLRSWRAWGKTGTAEIPGPQGYVDGAYTGTFVGGAPAGEPRAVCLISIYWPDRHKGYYGGTVAAPYVKDVLEHALTYWNIPPDRPEGSVVATAGERSGR